MGRSTGIDKRRTSRVLTRSRSGAKAKEDKHQELISFLEEKFGLKDLGNYTPMSDHEELVKDAVIAWACHSEAVFTPAEALRFWKSTPEGERFKEDLSYKKHKLEYWGLAMKAFVYQFNNLEKLDGPFFRGQSMRSGLPTDRMRSWSRDIKESIRFALGKPKIVGPNGQRDCASVRTILQRLREGTNEVDLAEGEKIVISLCVIEGQAEGLDLNATYLEQGRQEVIDLINRGETAYCLTKENGKWDRTKLSLDQVKDYLIPDIVEQLPQKEIEKLISENPDKTIENIIRFKTGNDFLDLVKKTNNPEILKTLEIATESLVKRAESYPAIAPVHYYSEEEEVIIHADDNVKRLEVTVAESIDEMDDMNTTEMIDVIASRVLEMMPDL